MFPSKTQLMSLLICALGFFYGSVNAMASQRESPRSFTVADEIGLAQFGDPYRWQAEGLQFSPDGNYFAVNTERGRLDLNCPEDSLRIYRSIDVEKFLEAPDEAEPPAPVWTVTRSTHKEGPIITDWRWLADSSGLAFLERTDSSHRRLVLADITTKTVELLTSTAEAVRGFDVRDRTHYVYSVTDPGPLQEIHDERLGPSMVGTGRNLIELLFPDDPFALSSASPGSYLWAVIDGKRFAVRRDSAPLIVFDTNLALSPDGSSLVTTLPIADVPSSWDMLYPPPFASSPWRIRAGYRDLQSGGSVHEYVRINLETGLVQPLTDAPVSGDAGLWAEVLGGPSWSSNGQAILLPGTFLRSDSNAPSRPCVAVVDLSTSTGSCVEVLKGHTETGVEENYHLIRKANFTNGDKHRVTVVSMGRIDSLLATTEYRGAADGTWQAIGHSKGDPSLGLHGLEVTVAQGLNEPPLLVATMKQKSRVVWDPNPQLKNIDIGKASLYTWKDEGGRDWRGGLFKPSNYRPGQRYPLVIQTHGFVDSVFMPSGIFPTAFAARDLAALGILVLQVDEQCPGYTPAEGQCAVSGYEAGARQLVSEGLVDPEKIGIIGFSRTCFYVLETLTTGSIHVRAASITDGVTYSYVQYMLALEIGPGDGMLAEEANAMIGAKPFGEGFEKWLRRSPGFRLENVKAPLLVNAEGSASLLFMWEPYAALRYLHKPVDLVVLNTDEHVLTNPAVRMVSQGGTVDWFRFWLKGEEDSEPSKAKQYTRWRELRRLQAETEKDR